MANVERIFARASAAFAVGGAFVLLVWAPLACLPEIPALPAAPEAPPAEIPQAPELQIPTFQAPEITTPEGPELPAQPPVSKGNCCIRSGQLLRDKCGGAMSCCTDEFKDTSACEDKKGLWFFTPEGCAGAC